MDTLLDAFDFDTHVFIPFQETVRFEGRTHLCNGLERKEFHRPVLDPILPDAYTNWGSDDRENSSVDEEIFAETFHFFHAAGEESGPDGGDIQLGFKVNREPATTPPVREMSIVTERGVEILTIKPRGKGRRRITRGCVELAISEWMKYQSDLPAWDVRKHPVLSDTIPCIIDGEVKQVAVWLWRGLEPDRYNSNIFRIYL